MPNPLLSLRVLLLCCSAAPLAARASAEKPEARTQAAAPHTAATQAVLSGTVVDPTGAKVPRATVHVSSAKIEQDAITDISGHYTLSLPPGTYDVTIVGTGFAPYINTVKLTTKPLTLDAKLPIATDAQEVTVASDASSTAASDNKSALVFKGSDLQTFSDDDATFQQQIQALAGSGDSQSGPQIYVDGFSNGRFPPKNSIREIRINQNPYSAQYDALGYGRIEIFTKPGSDKWNGYVDLSGNYNGLNTSNPFVGAQPPYHSLNLYTSASGPIGKKTSIFLSGVYNDQQTNAAVDATTLNLSTLTPMPFQQAVAAPTTAQTYAVRLDRQINDNNTFIGRYEFNRTQSTNAGVGLLVLPSEGTNSTVTNQTLQLTNTQVIGSKMVSETHFQYQRARTAQDANSSAPTLNVEGDFNGGGSPSQTNSDNTDRYEFQELFTRQQGNHFLRLGGRYRLARDANNSRAGFNGQFTFPNITAYQIEEQGLAANETDAQIRATCVTTATGQVCGGPTQYGINAGQSSAVVQTGDLGLFAEDEWKLRKNFTLDLGFRFETQSAIPDHFDPAPRLGFAWGIGQTDKRAPIVTLRGGGGLFYDRFASGNILTSNRENGVTQVSYVATNPMTFPSAPTLSSLSTTPPTVYQISPHLRSEYAALEGLAVERSLWKKGTISFNYLYSRGIHQWNSANINAPLPGTFVYGSTGSGVYPSGSTQPLYQFQSAGVFKTNRAFVNMSLNPTKHYFLFAFFVIRRQNGDSPGATSFPSNSYRISADYGRSSNPNQRLYLGNFYRLPHGFNLNAFLSATSATPFNVTTGTDLNGDSQYNDRPSFATSASPSSSVVKNRYGSFNTLPQPGETIVPFNYGTGPAFAELDLGFGKSFAFGPRPVPPPPPPGTPAPKGPAEKPDPRYSLSFLVDAQNATNHVNGGTPIGVLTSPSFGQSISLNSPFGGSGNAANRVVQLHMSFEF